MSIKNLAPVFVLVILSISASAQKPSFNYERSWKRIDSLINKNGQPKTALKEVNALYDAAKKEKKEDQLIKALVYKLNLNQQLSENSDSENIKSIENEIDKAKEPAKSVLNSIAASYYWNYLQRNRYKFYNRTDIPNSKNNDIATSGIESLHKKISDHYLASITQEQLLKQTNLSAFEPIIVKGNTRKLRPTLYDLLSHTALDYFKTGESDITRPAESFEIDDTLAFAEAKLFSAHKFKTTDSASLHFKALEIFKKLIAFHWDDQNIEALTDVDIERIQFVNQYYTIADKTERYSSVLQQLVDSRNSSMALYLLAEMHAAKAAGYDPLKDTSSRYEYYKAEILCKQASADKDSSEGKLYAQRLLAQIQRREIGMKSELVNVPGKSFRALIDYRNITSFSYRIIKLGREVKERTTNNWDEKFWKEILQLPVVISKELSFPGTNDHQLHRVEIPIDALPAGEYALIGSPDKTFKLNDNTLAIQNFYVSDIAFINSTKDYYLLDRTTGAPLPKATIQLWKNTYVNGASKLQKLSGPFTADKNGFVRIPYRQGNSNGAYIPEFDNGKDKLFITTNFTYSYNYDDIDNDKTEDDNVYFFTDRALYRPGQTVYFKGILVGKKKNESIVLPNKKSKIYLKDENDEDIDSLDLVTNAYGSYSGKFTIPSGLLNGTFTIADDETESQVTFNVEEYKRPKFEVSVIKPSGSYRVNDTISVTGSAKGYSGNAIDGAKLSYRIQRKYIRVFDYYFSSKIWPPSGQDQMEIGHGILTTANDGAFTIPFKAIPDAKISASQNPIFNYTVTVDVTDINGETRSAETNISVGYHAIKLDMTVPDFAKTDSFKVINITSVNTNDIFEPAKTSIRISKLTTPTKTFRERFWEQPDQFIMTREEYYNKFPFDFYSNEGDITSWPTEKEILSATFNTVKDSAFKIPKIISEPGWYAISATTKDKYNDNVTIVKYIQLYTNKIISPIAAVKIEGSTKSSAPADQINYSLLTNIDSAYLIRETLRQHKSKDLISNGPGKNTSPYKLNVIESDKGGMQVNVMLVKNSRFYADNYFVDIPFFDKQLKIEYLSFRDKTLPGSTEKWKVKITGARSEKVNAELITSMYDASLDQFQPHNWNVPALWNTSMASSNWVGEANFKAEEAFVRDFSSNSEIDFIKVYDRLILSNEISQDV
ncbi:MAG: MG2 domain-containing protein, partial [Flavitalea sp.]